MGHDTHVAEVLKVDLEKYDVVYGSTNRKLTRNLLLRALMQWEKMLKGVSEIGFQLKYV